MSKRPRSLSDDEAGRPDEDDPGRGDSPAAAAAEAKEQEQAKKEEGPFPYYLIDAPSGVVGGIIMAAEPDAEGIETNQYVLRTSKVTTPAGILRVIFADASVIDRVRFPNAKPPDTLQGVSKDFITGTAVASLLSIMHADKSGKPPGDLRIVPQVEPEDEKDWSLDIREARNPPPPQEPGEK